MTQQEYADTCRNHRPSFVRFARLYVRSLDDAEDVSDLAIATSLVWCGKLTRANFRKYMETAVRNASLNFLNLSRHIVETPLYTNEDGELLVDVIVHRHDDLRIDIRRAFQALPSALRTVATQLYAYEWTQKEIAAHRKCTEMSVSRMVAEINAQLRYYLRAYAGEVCKGGAA